MSIINEGEDVGEVAGILLVGDLTWRALKVRQIVCKLNKTSLILKIQFVHLGTCNQVQVDPVATARCLHILVTAILTRMMVFCVFCAMKIVV